MPCTEDKPDTVTCITLLLQLNQESGRFIDLIKDDHKTNNTKEKEVNDIFL